MENQQSDMIFCYGSAEADQFNTFREDVFTFKRGLRQQIKDSLHPQIVALSTGGCHSLVLDTHCKVYSWGLADEKQLGREGEDSIPQQVNLKVPVDIIGCGESFSVAINTKHSLVYFWGGFRNNQGKMKDFIAEPMLVDYQLFRSKTIKKVSCGANHCMVLADKQVYLWGDSETSVLGRIPLARRKLDQEYRVEGLGQRNIIDCWAAAYHNFIRMEVKSKGVINTVYKAWGLNQYGQLGIATTDGPHCIPQEILQFRNKNIIEITGGDHHTIGLEMDGNRSLIYAWGRNDDHQCGLGDKLNDYTQQEIDQQGESNIEKYAIRSPHLIDPSNYSPNITKIVSKEQFNYAYDEDGNIYSWGLNTYAKCGNMDEDIDTEPTPYKLKPNFIINPKLNNDQHRFKMLSIGAQHVVFITGCQTHCLKEDLLDNVDGKYIKGKKKSRGSSKGQVETSKSVSQNTDILGRSNTCKRVY